MTPYFAGLSNGWDGEGACRLHAVAELVAVLVAGVCQRLVKTHVLAGALAQLVHLGLALRGCQLVSVVLLAAMGGCQDCSCQPKHPVGFVCQEACLC